MQLHIKTE